MSCGIPVSGQIVRVRTRTWLVESVEPANGAVSETVVSLACLDDDAQGDKLDVVWGLELDTKILGKEAWQSIGRKGFDDPRFFSAFVHTLRWNCVTATDPKLFQAPFRAGIRIDAYQLEPLRKALLLPRVNLFIADDVGLGKTIEAGLIASELLLRRRVRDIVVACPPSMLLQWKDELENRFGLTFEVLDRAYIERVRQERGYGVNPWTTFPRFLVSHKLLIDEAYCAPLRDWLDNLRPGSLLIFDEAHHAAPASGARYAIDSKFTRAIRDVADRFEHRLFLSATPHNGHSNSFSALLEILDKHRFTRGVKVLKSNLDAVMIRRLKEDIRGIAGGFPKRVVRQVDIRDLPEDAPELALSRLLDEYRQVRQQRMAGATKRKQAEAALLISGLQQRLLSSVEAFARTLAVHRRTMERIWSADGVTRETPARLKAVDANLLTEGFSSDDDCSMLSEDEQQTLLDDAMVAATAATVGDNAAADLARERDLLARMESVAGQGRSQADARIRYLIEWIRDKMCPGAALPGELPPQEDAPWNELRLLIFTEYDDTKRYLIDMLRAAIADTHLAEYRIEVFHGPTPPDKREAIKRAFNLPPSEHPLRILVATDAAREGLNLQAHCHNIFHFDVPWNPSRLEQRNGRIDRKLQPSPEVYCHYFVYAQRPEDRVLRALVRKTETIRTELGSLAQVLEGRLTNTLKGGISHRNAALLEAEIEGAALDADKQAVTEEELEATRERQEALQKQIDQLRNRINDARKWLGLDMAHFRDALSCSLELLGSEPLNPVPTPPGTPARYVFPNLDTRHGADPTWATTIDTLRALPEDGKRTFQWRKDSPVRPVVFDAPEGIDDDIVQLHLEHRVVQRLLGRFLSQGFVHHDLSRACLAQSSDAIPRVVLLGRLSLYGKGAVRLHEEILTVTARWVEPERRSSRLSPYGRDAESKTLEILEQSFDPSGGRHIPDPVMQRLKGAIDRDIDELLPHLEKRGEEARKEAEVRLSERGRLESDGMRKILEEQKRRVEAEFGKTLPDQLTLAFNDDEKRQMESNRKYWQRWLAHVEVDLRKEPARIMEFYQTSSFRVEPVGLAYLWPVTG
ncbi:helicase [Oryzomonas rubra]|uniref:Helicase n=1 Tax=Oryzomonas rubra TaxID=2509454 RepID=A0A5A9XTU4_9BACT|nr:helicase [Oryzomonas rubra]